MTPSENKLFARWIPLSLLPAAGALYFAFFLRENGIAVADAAQGEHVSSLLLFAAQDGLGGALSGAVLVVASFLPLADVSRRFKRLGASATTALALVAFLMGILIGIAVFHGYPMSLDEFIPTFQAAIFREGFLLAQLDVAALALNQNLQPYFTYVDEARALWTSNYRPMHAALIVATPQLGGLNLLNPLMAAVSIVAMADISRRVFPEERLAPGLAALLLLSSPQFLINAGSGFSYPVHLGLNLVWLALFLRGTTWAHIAAALVGALTIGLHQVHVHPLFAVPFLTGLLFGVFGPRWRLAIYVVVYTAALLFWMAWHEIATWVQTGDTSVLPRSLMEIAYIQDYLRYSDSVEAAETGLAGYFLAANLLRFLLWISPAILLLVAVALTTFNRIPTVVKLAALGVVLMVAATHALMPNQMLSWGARYYHPVLGNMVLLAVAGFASVSQSVRACLAAQTATALLLSLAVLLPVRALQVEAKVGPRAEVQARIEEIDADLVAFPPMPIWFLPDFIRNDPFLHNRPLLAVQAPGTDFGPLAQEVTILSPDDLWGFGLPRGTLYEPGNPAVPRAQ